MTCRIRHLVAAVTFSLPTFHKLMQRLSSAKRFMARKSKPLVSIIVHSYLHWRVRRESLIVVLWNSGDVSPHMARSRADRKNTLFAKRGRRSEIWMVSPLLPHLGTHSNRRGPLASARGPENFSKFHQSSNFALSNLLLNRSSFK